MQTKQSIWINVILLSLFFLGACTVRTSPLPSTPVEATLIPVFSPAPTQTTTQMPTEAAPADPSLTPKTEPTTNGADLIVAYVRSVEVTGDENAYQFSVEIRSPDTGCEQYADWWEVISEEGDLIYRRILTHSHASEQPFTRSGGLVEINADTIVIVRAHMHPEGYGGAAFRGSMQGGFEEIQLEADFAPDLEFVDPLPAGCAF
jgi:hypothetical protein